MLGFMTYNQQIMFKDLLAGRCVEIHSTMPEIIMKLGKSRVKGQRCYIELFNEMQLCGVPMLSAIRYINRIGVIQQMFENVSSDIRVLKRRQGGSNYIMISIK